MKYSYIIFAYSALFIFGFIDNAKGPLYPQLLDYFSLSQVQGSLIFSLSSGLSFITSIFAKVWLKRFGAILSTRIALSIQFLSTLIMALCGPDQFYLFLLGSCLFGISVGVEGITLNLIVAKASSKTKSRQTLAGLHAMYGVASFLIPYFVYQLGLIYSSHKEILIALSIIPLIAFISTIKLKSLNIKENIHHEVKLVKRNVLILGFSIGMYVSTEMLLSSRLVLYYREVGGFDKIIAGQLLSLFFGGLLAGRVLFTIFKIPISSLNLLKISIGLGLIFSILGITVYKPILALNGLSMSFFFPCAIDYIGENFKHSVELLVSKVFIFVGAGLVSMHWVFGLISQYYGITAAMCIVPTFQVIILYLLQFKYKTLIRN